MSLSAKSLVRSLLEGASWLLFAAAGLCFWCGGRELHEFAHTEWLLAEIEGIALTVVFAALGAGCKTAAENLD